MKNPSLVLAVALLCAFLVGQARATYSPTTGNGTSPALPSVAGGRLTLSSTVSRTTTDQTSAHIVYYLRDVGSTIAVYTSSTATWSYLAIPSGGWSLDTGTFGGSGDPGGLGAAASTCYDICLMPAGALVGYSWSSSGAGSSTRRLAIIQQDGALVQTTTLYRFLGTLRTTSSTLLEDSSANRLLSNAQNSVPTPDGWTYDNGGGNPTQSSTTWAVPNSAAAPYVHSYVQCLAGLPARFTFTGGFARTGGSTNLHLAVSIDGSLPTFSSIPTNSPCWTIYSGNTPSTFATDMVLPDSAGYHTASLAWAVDSGNTFEIFNSNSQAGTALSAWH